MTEDPPDSPVSGVNPPAVTFPGEDRAAALGRILIAIHEEMQSHIAHRLGSREAAQDALQDAWLRLQGGPAIGPVTNPKAYLIRMVLNLGRNRMRGSSRLVTLDQTLIEELADAAPDPERNAAARRELAAVMELLEELPDRRRMIFLDKFRDSLSLDESARLRGVHRRTVQKELERTVKFLRVKLRTNRDSLR